MKRSRYIILLLTILLSACAEHNATPGAGQLNAAASLPGTFDFSKMGLKTLASTVNKKQGTMSALYGNDAAKATEAVANGKCVPGTVFALVTWQQQEDKRWIGGNIPGNLLSVEMLKAAPGNVNGTATYSRFKGAELTADIDTAGQYARTAYILGLKPSLMF